MKLGDLLVWLALIFYFTDASQTLIDIIHGPQPRLTTNAPAPTTKPNDNTELKPSW